MVNIKRLPMPIHEKYDWQFDGACMGLASEVFFSPEGERGAAKELRERGAKAVCDRCPVVEACLEHALRAREEHGVWGGLSAEERREALQRPSAV